MANGEAGRVATETDRVVLLRAAVEDNFEGLRRTIALYVGNSFWLGDRNERLAVANEVLDEAVARALRRPEAFDPNRPARAWLLGIANNVLRERLRQQGQDRQHRVHTVPRREDESIVTPSEATLATLADLSANDEFRLIELLDLVGPDDQRVLRLAYVERLRGPALAEALGTKEGAARVRLHRAVARLSDAYRRAESNSEGR